MQQRFIELTSALVEEIGIQCDIVPGENIVTVPIGDVSVNLCLLEDLGAVVFQGSVAVIAASDKNAVCAELLRMNSLLQALSAGQVDDLTVTEPELEEIFLHYYEKDGETV